MAKYGKINKLRRAMSWLIFTSILSLGFWIWVSTDAQPKSKIVHHKQSIRLKKYKHLSRVHKEPSIQNKKTILLWTVPFHDYAMVPENLFIGYYSPTRLSSISWNTTQCGNCKITYNRALLNSSDAVVFHAFYPNATTTFLHKQYDKQIFVWWSQESSSNAPYHSFMNKYFDWTMTPSRRADVYSPYASFAWMLKLLRNKMDGFDFMVNLTEMKGDYPAQQEDIDYFVNKYFGGTERIKKSHKKSTGSIQQLIAKKQKLVSWIASNCRTSGAKTRLYVVDSLEDNGLIIDKFGSCNYNDFPFSRWDPAFYEVLSMYKFYLSFENSIHCRDYITEKLWYNALYSGTVPVIWGPHRDDVRAVLPPKSYIHMEDFNSVRDVVKYLKYLNTNDTAYAEYLEWRTWAKYLDKNGEYHPETLKETAMPDENLKILLKKYLIPKQIGFCRLCRMLHAMQQAVKRKPAGTGYSKTERAECQDETRRKRIAEKLCEG